MNDQDLSQPSTEWRYSPFFAALAQKSPEQQQAFFERFYRAPQRRKDFIASSEVSDAIHRASDAGIIPEEYIVAIGKIMAYVALEEVRILEVPPLLEKLGLSTEQVKSISATLEPLLATLSVENPTQSTPMPPSPQPPGRNIIDLRKPQT